MFDEKLFKDTFDQVHASDALLTEVLEMTTKSKQKQHTPKRVLRTLLIAAVLICALTVTVVAADTLAKKFSGDTISVIEAFFGENGKYVSGGNIVEYDEWGKLAINMPAWSREPLEMEVAERLVAPYLYTLEENTVTKGGFTYTIHAILYDSNTKTYMVRWSVENPDGLGDYGIGMNGEFFTKEGSDIIAVCGGRDYLDTANSTDTKLYLSSFGVDWQDELYCEFGRWYDWDQGKMEAWIDSQKVILPRADRGGMPALRFNDGSITVSPVALRVDGVRVDGVHVDSLKECTICFKDGSEYVVCSDEAFVQNTTYGLGDTDFVTYTFNRIVDVENVSAIIVNGQNFPVE